MQSLPALRVQIPQVELDLRDSRRGREQLALRRRVHPGNDAREVFRASSAALRDRAEHGPGDPEGQNNGLESRQREDQATGGHEAVDDLLAINGGDPSRPGRGLGAARQHPP